MAITKSYWEHRKVLVTGHTGFKGSWLTLVLKSLGAEVYGLALENNSAYSLYQSVNIVDSLTQEYFADIRDSELIDKYVKEVNPEVIFHLAAESLVLNSFSDPLKTFQVNILGTFNVLWAATKPLNNPIIVVVTSDKCYRNDGAGIPFQESDPLGGGDPYSASKACAEIVSSSFQYSFGESRQMKIATVRAGNVIGGGDWSENRLIPDFFRAIMSSKSLSVRSPKSTRPWQHVLEPLIGYMSAVEYMHSLPATTMNSWNFGPDNESIVSVENILRRFNDLHPTLEISLANESQSKEAIELRLDSSLAKKQLDWKPLLDIDTTISLTSEWYSRFFAGENMQIITEMQISRYLDLVQKN
jgi:CDP-glucose 4,6-dehydratase